MLVMKRITLADVVSSRRRADFAERLIDQLHASPEMLEIVAREARRKGNIAAAGIEHETPDETKARLLADTRFPYKSKNKL